MRGFKNFLMRGDVIVVAVGLVVALAFSALITAFTTNIINPLVQSFTGGKNGLGVEIRAGHPKTIVDFGSFISAVIYFVIFIAVVYFLIVVPYKHVQARRGHLDADEAERHRRGRGRDHFFPDHRQPVRHGRDDRHRRRLRGYELRPAGPMSPVR